ncbi:GNAT family N-acetyltransferase [Pelagibacterium montanilacus]|uniref:GNAT family N-acetyltransferase n=1 Tax=Pelagibacterium montanilacus TaxID=2185280 RepID=UPI001FE65DD9|nr:GNAT family N-acetyltransferase [Pelagibacterium montanilacus]
MNVYRRVLVASTLGERRPVDDIARLSEMLAHSDVIVVARDAGGTAIGVARSITDYAFCLYCSDLAVDAAHQGQGIGKRLLEETVRAAPRVRNYLLLSAPKAVSFYEHAGFERLPDAFRFYPQDGWSVPSPPARKANP